MDNFSVGLISGFHKKQGYKPGKKNEKFVPLAEM